MRHRFKLNLIGLSVLSMAIGCSDVNREAVSFSCQTLEARNAEIGREVTFHHDDGFLFLQNAEGGADNICNQEGTTYCRVDMNDAALTFRQTVDKPDCSWRGAVDTSLNINRETGTFRFVQEACDPGGDMVITGTCRFWNPPN